jgi:hypothetical protein
MLVWPLFGIAIDYAVTILRYALLALILLVMLCACHSTNLRFRRSLHSSLRRPRPSSRPIIGVEILEYEGKQFRCGVIACTLYIIVEGEDIRGQHHGENPSTNTNFLHCPSVGALFSFSSRSLCPSDTRADRKD